MTKILNIFASLEKKHNRFFIAIGMFVSMIGYLPNILLGKGSVFRYQDQLDGEIFTYIFAAKYLGQDVSVYQEMFNGIHTDGLIMPAPMFVFIYRVLEPFTALLCMHLIVSALAFLGMYLLINKCYENKIVAFIAGLVFAYLPFFGVYGLSIMGVPLLVYAFSNLLEEKKRLVSYLIICFYATVSSLTLVGIAILLNLFFVLIFLYLRKKKIEAKNILLGTIILGVTYLILNRSLIEQVLSVSDNLMISHKEEILVYAVPFWTSFKEFFFYGSFHMQSYQFPIVIFSIIIIFIGLIRRNKESENGKKLLDTTIAIFIFNLIISILSALFAIEPVVAFRNEVGGVLKYFQLNRMSWLTPCTWYFLFAVIILYIIEWVRTSKKKKIVMCFTKFFLLMVVFTIAGNVLYNSTFKVNVRQMVNPSTSNSITWDKYYNEALFKEVDSYIGIPKEDYRVISLGIAPSMPLYSGFYCLDGYSNNYDLNYKNEFRKIMEEELSKNEALRMYYDNWGNRCYLLSDELGQDFFYRKGNEIIVKNLELNTKQIYEMGGRYLFSGVQIDDNRVPNLQFEKYFENENSSIGIYLYKIIE